MSDIIKSLRLNPDKTMERRAIDIINRAEANGIDFKGLVLPLILDLEGFTFESPLHLTRELLVSIDEVRQIAQALQQAGTLQYVPQPQHQEKEPEDTAVSPDDALVQSLMNKARTGRRRTGN